MQGAAVPMLWYVALYPDINGMHEIMTFIKLFASDIDTVGVSSDAVPVGEQTRPARERMVTDMTTLNRAQKSFRGRQRFSTMHGRALH
ncbi:hypothetical protein IFM12275_24310 [Nocardia sputorum]|nr:hypothetical protein IFM12275_24310 [Nocardia sputorum]